MMQEERFELITAILSTRNSVTIRELVEACTVTAETIRSDLKSLEKTGILTRSHGGATKQSFHTETPYYLREISNIAQKKAIAREAVNYIIQNDKIILDSSSTSYFVAQILPNIPLTVLTNSLRIQEELVSKDHIEVLSSGGILLRSSLCLVGKPAISMLRGYHVNKAFISSTAIHHEGGVSEPSELAIAVKRTMIEIADQVFLLMDSSKFEIRDFIQVAPVDAFNRILTDSLITNEVLEKFNDYINRIQICKI